MGGAVCPNISLRTVSPFLVSYWVGSHLPQYVQPTPTVTYSQQMHNLKALVNLLLDCKICKKNKAVFLKVRVHVQLKSIQLCLELEALE